ncbi:MAG: hypothetical protein LLG01_01195 [Planctomycetaceae bacterium]|nr:hypothetical protein [Planctomycetaceae bacterium]
MKAQRRHELQHNVLGTELSKLGTFLKKYGTYVAWAVLIVALIALIANYAIGRKRTAARDVLAKYESVTADPNLKFEQRVEDLKALSQQETNRFVAALAGLTLGDDYTARLVNLPPTATADERKKAYDQAEACYRQTLDSFPDNPSAVGRARFGLARLAETMRDFDAARRELTAIKTDPRLAGTPAVALAEKELNELSVLSQPVAMAAKKAATAPSSAEATGATTRAATAPATRP